MPTYLTDDALCLRVTDFSETSQIVALFTRHHGLLPLIAKGAKRTSKKNTMSGPLDLLTSGQAVFIPPKDSPGHGTSLGTLAAWDLANHRQHLRTNLPALNAAMLCAELTTHLVHPNDPHEDLFLELQATLELLETAPQRPTVAYAKAALRAAGYLPHLASCLACGRNPADNLMQFSPQAGGIFCPPNTPGCAPKTVGTTLPIQGLIVLALDRLPAPTALRDNPPQRPPDASALQSALQILLTHIEFITNKPLRTRYLLPTVFAAKPPSN